MSKRKLDSEPTPTTTKKAKGPDGAAVLVTHADTAPRQSQPPGPLPPLPPNESGKTRKQKKPKMNKLAPRRPWPTVPKSVSATGPSSLHHEGKNYICITRKTALGAYMRRCKDLIYKDGYRALHLSAMGAAIPLLAQLAAALPPILEDQIRTEITTGTCDVQDERIPDNDEDDIEIKTRSKSTLRIVLRVGPESQDTDGPPTQRKAMKGKDGKRRNNNTSPTRPTVKLKDFKDTPQSNRTVLVYEEPDQMDE